MATVIGILKGFVCRGGPLDGKVEPMLNHYLKEGVEEGRCTPVISAETVAGNTVMAGYYELVPILSGQHFDWVWRPVEEKRPDSVMVH